MDRHHSLICAVVCLLPAGCSSYPLPQDTTGRTTKAIVRHVRCEARDALTETAAYAFQTYFKSKDVWKHDGIVYTGESLAAELRRQPKLISDIKIKDLRSGAQDAFKYYQNSQIAYEFTLDLTESNTDTIGMGFKHNFLSKRVDTVDSGLTSLRIRENKRAFSIVDTFSELIQRVGDDYCETDLGVNIAYPTIGKIPIHDLIINYVEVNEFDNLGHIGDGKGNYQTIVGTKAQPAVPQMGDTLTFTTRFTGSINPIAMLMPAAPGLALSSFNAKTENYREDKHNLIIVVSTAPEANKQYPIDPSDGLPTVRAPGQPPVARLRGDKPSTPFGLTSYRYQYGLDTLAAQREKNVQDAIIQIGSGLSRGLP